ncbi:universal stress protein [Massilia sp. BJB1822]|uniref:universal stress protein n=1 Tax=Massilia sp. BJB1822 TaxID=2744470 RepID=UPI001592F586|nr:universal stress protein [Massilia sp. BJB1822]NVE01281.1 universal stress protein [Massilia sp. BJB1822]
MSYKTILVHADLSRAAPQRIRIAAELANAGNGHLIGAALTSTLGLILPGSFELGGEALATQMALMREDAQSSLSQFDALARAAGVSSAEKRIVDDDADGGMMVQARYADLVVVGQYDPDDKRAAARPDLPEYVMLNSARPVLVVPYAGKFERVGRKVLLAWDASMEATRAIANALPMLKAADLVTLAVFNPDERYGKHGEQPGADLALYLSRHGIKVEVSEQQTTMDVGNALLSLAADIDADLLVMGGYGHARFRQLLIGGVTRTILKCMTLPVLMSH